VCDVPESCTGGSAFCPGNGFQPPSTLCRGSAGVCDVEEFCTGSSAPCPGDGFVSGGTPCRGAVDVCDAVETCTGGSASCPGDGVLPNGTLCRGSTGFCDASEFCDGSSTACPSDGCQDDGAPTACGSAMSLGSVGAGGGAGYTGCALSGQTDWFVVDFPDGSRPGAGTPSVSVSGNVRMDVGTGCGGTANCSGGWSFVDNQSLPGFTQWSSHFTPWPTSAYIGVSHASSPANCNDAAYDVNVSR
jgi:hypothetical protein